LFKSQSILIAKINNSPVGFITLKSGYYIDLLFVHKKHQRKGIAQKLYSEIESMAKKEKQNKLKADVSITAKPFFKNVGFKVIRKQKLKRQGIELINYQMEKTL